MVKIQINALETYKDPHIFLFGGLAHHSFECSGRASMKDFLHHLCSLVLLFRERFRLVVDKTLSMLVVEDEVEKDDADEELEIDAESAVVSFPMNCGASSSMPTIPSRLSLKRVLFVHTSSLLLSHRNNPASSTVTK